MKLKRYTAPDIKQAMAKVRDELGSDAVILSNRNTEDGIEIIAAMDYDDAIIQTPLLTQKEKDEQQRSLRNRSNVKVQNTRQSRRVVDDAQDIKKRQEKLLKSVGVKPVQSSKAQWKKAFEETYESQKIENSKDIPSRRAELNSSELTNFESQDFSAQNRRSATNDYDEFSPLTDRRKPNVAAQVSSEWVDQFKTNLETQDDDEPPSSLLKNTQDNDELKNVWDELSSLRGLLETQLSSLAWRDASKRHPTKAKVLKHLLELGITPEISYHLLNEISDEETFERCWRKSLAKFVKRIPIVEEDIIAAGGIFALVGPTGVGKTTTIAKLAARYALKHGTEGIALVTTDNYRIGAQEQLRTYGRILGTPVKIANNAEELRNVLKSLFDKQLILIDTAGMSQRDMKLTEQFSMLSEGSILIKSYLVISASSQQQVLDETVNAYKQAFLDGCIITKLDETLSLGGALSTIVQHKLPISYISDGQRVPEDLHRASAVELVKSSVAMMNRAKIELDENVVELAYGELAANDLS